MAPRDLARRLLLEKEPEITPEVITPFFRVSNKPLVKSDGETVNFSTKSLPDFTINRCSFLRPGCALRPVFGSSTLPEVLTPEVMVLLQKGTDLQRSWGQPSLTIR